MFVILFLLFFCSVTLILYAVLRVPTWRVTKAAMDIRQGEHKAHTADAIVLSAAASLGKHIRLGKLQKRKMEKSLQFAGVALTPETYIARAIVVAVAKLPLLAFGCLFSPVLAVPCVLAWALHGLLRDFRGAQKIAAKKREEINDELARFADTIAQELQYSRNVVAMLEGYRLSAGPEFQRQLGVTIADMKSGNHEAALKRLELRVGSVNLSEIVRGLLAVLSGNDGVRMFQQLAYNFNAQQVQKLERVAKKRPHQAAKWPTVLMVCVIATYMLLLLMYLLSQGSQLLQF